MTPTTPRRRAEQSLQALLEPVVVKAGFDLEELVEQRAGSRRLVRVAVDADGGVSLDDIAQVSRLISDALDQADSMGAAPYVLEVTSPGVDRPLTLPRHWRRAVDRLVKAGLTTGGEVFGRVVSADEDAVTLLVQDIPRTVAYAEIAKAKVQVEFNRPTAADQTADADEDSIEDGDADEDGLDDDGWVDGDGADDNEVAEEELS
jgi:ribosome maturation factor RimP